MPYYRSDDTDNASSVATPEEHAVSTMIMALESLSSMGQTLNGKSNSVPDGTPIRSNLSWGKEEEDETNNNNPGVRRYHSSNEAVDPNILRIAHTLTPTTTP